MELFYYSSDRRLTALIFAESEDRASELFGELLIMSGVPSANFWSRPMGIDDVVGDARKHLEVALARGEEGFGEYEPLQGWEIIPLAQRIQRLLDEPG
jgi:hypothetical protein